MEISLLDVAKDHHSMFDMLSFQRLNFPQLEFLAALKTSFITASGKKIHDYWYKTTSPNNNVPDNI